MPVTPTYPGVYIEELSSGVRTITGVPTSVTAFVGPALRGPVDEAYRITSWADFDRVFGGLWRPSLMSYAVYHYYQNGGAEAVIVRVAHRPEEGEAAEDTPVAATITLPAGTDSVVLETLSTGDWGNKLRARVEYPAGATDTYNLLIRDMATGAEERFLNVSPDVTSPRSLETMLKRSELVKARSGADKRPDKHDDVPRGADPFADPPPTTGTGGGTTAEPNNFAQAEGGQNGAAVADTDIVGDGDATGIYALRKTDIFNLLVIPPLSADTNLDPATYSAAAQLCVAERAMLIVDAPNDWTTAQQAADNRDDLVGPIGIAGRNAALFFPRVYVADPLRDNLLDVFPASGIIAGVFARTDTQRGVWKAPAGTDATLNGARRMSVPLTDGENGLLNPLAVNCLRILPVYGPVVWGSRTMRGADQLADDDYKYVPVRRLTLYIEESLYRGLQWVVFEPNDEPLWSQIRLNAGAFMQNLFRQGAFKGSSPREAYFVKCDKETTTQNDINRGIVNVIVGFAPLKPAEFVIVKIQQMAGQIQV